MASMPHDDWQRPPDGPSPLMPTIEWSGPTDVVSLYEGPLRLHRGNDASGARPGSVRLLLRSGSSIEWQVDLEGADHEQWGMWRNRREDPGPTTLEMLPQASMKVPAFLTGDGRGIVQGTRPEASYPAVGVVRAVAFSLPALLGAEPVVRRHPDGTWASWSARTILEIEDWQIVIEAREDLNQLLSDAKRERLFLGTHVVNFNRLDQSLFSGNQAHELLAGLTFGLSFALGRWVGLIHAQGLSPEGLPLWTQWGAPHAEPPNRGSTRWWNEHRPEDLLSFLRSWLSRWLHAEPERQPLSFLVTSALAAGEGAFVEQRLLTIMAALEHYWWAFARGHGLSLGPRMHIEDGDAARKIRALLQAIGLGPSLPAEGELATYARDHQLVDSPHVLTYLRNRLTHPKATEQIYERQGLIAEASRLARRYFDLVLLWEVSYQGHACDGTQLNRWAGESDPVPWHAEGLAAQSKVD